MKKYLKYSPIILLLVLAFFLRTYKMEALFGYAHDSDLASWIVKDIVENGHMRLIGQQTSVLGVFIGGLFYYLQVPFYLLGNMDPIYTPYLTAILGTFSVFSFYFVFTKIWDRKTGLIAALIYAVARFIVFSDRGVYPTMPVMLWTVWYLYDLFLIYKGRQKQGFILFGILFSLIWHMNIALYILTPLALLSLIASRAKIQWKYLLVGAGVLIISSSPFIVFEARHDFQQTRAIISSLVTDKNLLPETGTGWAKLDRVMQLVRTNTTNLFFPYISKLSNWTAISVLAAAFIVLAVRKVIKKETAILFVCWQILYIGFFSFNSINVSEYYLDGMNVVWIAIMALALGRLLKKGVLKSLGFALLASYAVWNVGLILRSPDATDGYVYRKAIVDAIDKDAKEKGYPCVAISYITKPGYNLGYRYFFYLNDMHVNNPESQSPVYTIVFPLELVDKFDKRFGDLGLIYPDYGKYNEKDVKVSCSGANSNLTDSMFGYTE